MRFGVLGSLQVIAGDSDEPGVVSAARLRALLAVLLWRANQPVPVDELAELVWDGAPPGGAPEATRALVMRLRRRLDKRAAARIVTRAPGYAIEVSGGELDAWRFETLTQKAGAAVHAGRWAAAARTAAEALGLWRGTPLMDIASQILRDQWVPQLEQLHVQALEWRIEADLHESRHEQLIPELRDLTIRHPLREHFHGQLMLALAKSGRQAEALTVYQEARRVLANELGIDPGTGLRRLQERILARDASLMTPPTAAEASLATAGPDGPVPGSDREGVVPRQLPAPVQPFIGREAELAELDGLLERVDGPATVVISAIAGTAGVGKTALAVHWAHQIAERFPDGQLYANLRGFDPTGNPTPAATAIRALLDALEVPAKRIPASLDAQSGLYRSLMAGRRMLLVLDNARDAEQVRPLLPGSAGCLVVVTSRSDLAGLAAVEAAHSLRLGLLTDAEAHALLAARLGPARIDAEPGAAAELVRLCARLPLALVIAAARAAARPRFRLRAFTGELADARNRLDALDTGDALASVRAVFSWSAGSLPAPVARMFGLLGLHPGPDIAVPAAASLAGVPLPQARAALAALADAGLTAEHSPGRFSLHDLLRAYAAEQARAHGSDSANREAVGQVLDHYLHTAHAAALLLNPSREPITLTLARPGVTPEHVVGDQQAIAWFEAEHHVLLSAATLAAETGFDTHAWQLPWAMTTFLDRRGHWHDYAAIQRTALAAATRLGDQAGQAAARRLLAHSCVLLGDCDQARAHLADCLRLCRQLGDRAGEARAHQTLCFVAERQADYVGALGHAEQFLTLLRLIDDRAGQASALNNVGWCHALLGDYQRARAFSQQALALHRDLGNRYGEAHAWDSLGYAEHQLGRLNEAAAHYEHALDIIRDLGDHYSEATTLTHLGDTRHASGDPQGAQDAWQQALAILDDLDHPDAARVRAKLQQLGEQGAGLGGSQILGLMSRLGRGDRHRRAPGPSCWRRRTVTDGEMRASPAPAARTASMRRAGPASFSRMPTAPARSAVDVLVGVEGGDDHDPQRVGDARAGERAGDLDAVQARHADVDQAHVRAEPPRQRYGLRAVRGLGCHGDVRLGFQDEPENASDHGLVVGQQYPQCQAPTRSSSCSRWPAWSSRSPARSARPAGRHGPGPPSPFAPSKAAGAGTAYPATSAAAEAAGNMTRFSASVALDSPGQLAEGTRWRSCGRWPRGTGPGTAGSGPGRHPPGVPGGRRPGTPALAGRDHLEVPAGGEDLAVRPVSVGAHDCSRRSHEVISATFAASASASRALIRPCCRWPRGGSAHTSPVARPRHIRHPG
jgi:DNA-binding SARP family transcriptional activator